MSLPNEKQAPKEIVMDTAFQVKREGGGYCLYQLGLQNNKVITKSKISEPDVLVIAISHLEKSIRRENGL